MTQFNVRLTDVINIKSNEDISEVLILIKSFGEQIIYNNIFTLYKDNEIWIKPDNDIYLDYFKIEFFKDNNILYLYEENKIIHKWTKEQLNSNSQVLQDLFAYILCDTNNGYFLDFGSAYPVYSNNTYLLEKNGWNGLCFEINDEFEKLYSGVRKSKFIKGDATKMNLLEILKENNCPNVIDYISIDIDESTIDFLDVFPFDLYDSKFITFEHDSYHRGNILKDKAFELFSKLGYSRYKNDVLIFCEDGEARAFEDWYINHKYINNYLSYDNIISHYTKVVSE